MVVNVNMNTDNNASKANFSYEEISSHRTGYLTDIPEDRYDNLREAMVAFFLASKNCPDNIVSICRVTPLDEEGMPEKSDSFFIVRVGEDRPCTAKKLPGTKTDGERKAEIVDQLNTTEQQLDSIGDEIFDDGTDAGDYEQNQRFSLSVRTIKKAGRILAGIDIPGVESEVLNTLWKKCWKDWDPFYPECMLWHHKEYIKALREIIG